MRGIEFQIKSQYGDILNYFLGEYHEKYDFQISEEEFISENEIIEESKHKSYSLFSYLKKISPYYVNFVQIRAYPKGNKFQPFETYCDFLKSTCQFVFLVIDGHFFEFYSKNSQLILDMIQKAEKIKAEPIKVKTDYSDGRNCFSLW